MKFRRQCSLLFVSLDLTRQAELIAMGTPVEKLPTVAELSRAKMKPIDESVLDTQTIEYYTFGESVWFQLTVLEMARKRWF